MKSSLFGTVLENSEHILYLPNPIYGNNVIDNIYIANGHKKDKYLLFIKRDNPNAKVANIALNKNVSIKI